MTVALALPGERAGRPAPDGIAQARAQMAGAAAAGLWATDPAPVEEWHGGVRVLRFAPPSAARARVVQFHGGGFRMGMPEYCGPFAAALVAACSVSVHAVHYRLAPEHPFPAGLADGLAVLRALAAAKGPPLLLLGDSAGGGLAASLALLAHGEGIALAGLVLLSPWLDLTVTAPAYAENAASDPLFSREAAQVAAELYLQGHDPRDPLASPLFGPAGAFPPALVSVGDGEVLRDDATSFHRRLEEAGIDATLSVIDGMDHVAAVRGADLPGSAETFAAVCAFVDRIVPARD